MGFENTKYLIRQAEQAIVDRKALRERDDTLRAYSEEGLFGPWLVISGAKVLFRRLAWALVVSGSVLAFLCLIERTVNASLVAASFALGFGSIYFGLPSRTAISSGITNRNLGILTSKVTDKATTLQDLEAIGAGVNVVRTQAMDRLARFNVLAAIAWGALFWYVSSHVLAPNASQEVMQRGLAITIPMVMFFALVLMVGACYSAGVRSVYQILDFALIEAKTLLIRQAQSANI